MTKSGERTMPARVPGTANMRLESKVAIVTGGTSGIGRRVTAATLLEPGMF